MATPIANVLNRLSAMMVEIEGIESNKIYVGTPAGWLPSISLPALVINATAIQMTTRSQNTYGMSVTALMLLLLRPSSHQQNNANDVSVSSVDILTYQDRVIEYLAQHPDLSTSTLDPVFPFSEITTVSVSQGLIPDPTNPRYEGVGYTLTIDINAFRP